MKIISSSIVCVALVYLMCLLPASNASTQLKLPPPCCYNTDSTPDLLVDGETSGAFMLNESHGYIRESMSPTNSINSKMLPTLNVLASSGIAQFSNSTAMPNVDRKDAHGFFVNDRKIYFGERS